MYGSSHRSRKSAHKVAARKQHEEANLFRFFLDLEPLFAGEPVRDWNQADDDPPDVLCYTETGRRVGDELSSWLDEEQMQCLKHRERIETRFLEAIGEQPKNTTENFRWIWLHPRDRVHMSDIDHRRLREELFDLILRSDCNWPRDNSGGISNFAVPDSSLHPTLVKVLHSIQCWPRRPGDTPTSGIPWVIFPNWGGPYDPRDMGEALKRRLTEKREQYRTNAKVRAFSEFVLLIHYDQALRYNSPVIGLRYGFDEAVADAKTSLAGDPGSFSRIFVMKAVEPGGRVWRIYP